MMCGATVHQASAMNLSDKWFEIWFHDNDPPYLLLVCPGDDPTTIEIHDLHEKTLAYVAKNYEDAYWWLLEDDFEMVRGRERENREE